MGAAASTAFAFNVGGKVLGKETPSSKLNLAIIGAGGLVAIADVDKVRSANAVRNHPNARFFTDFRVMFDKMADNIDAVIVCTPDHNHCTAATAAMERGKHVYCE